MNRAVWQGRLIQCYRVAIMVAIVWIIRSQHDWIRSQESFHEVTISEVTEWLPNAFAFAEKPQPDGTKFILDEAGERIGFFAITSPASDWIIGYSGPTTTLLVFDESNTCLGARIIKSGDTEDHVAKIIEEPEFLEVYTEKTWDEITQLRDIDAVTGATLTSLAVNEGIIYRLAGEGPNLRFPDPITVKEVQSLFPDAANLVEVKSSPPMFSVQSNNGTTLGWALNTAHLANRIQGYQGPIDVLIALEPDQKSLVGVKIRKSYDNARYVEDVIFERYFFRKFENRDVTSFLGIDYREHGIDGVSGATMTSYALAEAVTLTLQEIETSSFSDRFSLSIDWKARDLFLFMLITLACLMTFTRLKTKKRVRITYQLFLVIYVGFISGDMVAQAVLLGWSQSGIAWLISPGLVFLVAASLLLPAVTGKQVYCHHTCPHGAAQQLLMRYLPKSWRIQIPNRIEAWFKPIPVVLIACVCLIGMLALDFNVASLEPFDGYSWRAAGWITSSLLFGSLIFSAFVPMGYCRYGCPTGKLLDFVRFHHRGEKFGSKEIAGTAFLFVGLALFLLRHHLI
jgi:Na+-translocating ferredoxin:NAD+ oxidoreductase RnfG subunit